VARTIFELPQLIRVAIIVLFGDGRKTNKMN